METQFNQQGSHVSNPIKRIRWATQRVTGNNERRKRRSILNRFHKRGPSTEKKRESGDSSQTEGMKDGTETPEDGDDRQDGGRRIFFNIPLPEDAKDEDGHPLANFARNKVRTAKYTPLSFIPKDLWSQFHNIANVYFLFVVILGVRDSASSFCQLADEQFRYSLFLVLPTLLLPRYL